MKLFISMVLAFGISTSLSAQEVHTISPSDEGQQTNLDREANLAEARRLEVRLVRGYRSDSVLGQIQAQAMCVAKAPGGSGNVKAIFRKPIGEKEVPGTGKLAAYSLSCPKVCEEFKSDPYGKNMTSIGGVHVYSGRKPFLANDDNNLEHGLSTYVYAAPASNEFYGPNYCCCHAN